MINVTPMLFARIHSEVSRVIVKQASQAMAFHVQISMSVIPDNTLVIKKLRAIIDRVSIPVSALRVIWVKMEHRVPTLMNARLQKTPVTQKQYAPILMGVSLANVKKAFLAMAFHVKISTSANPDNTLVIKMLTVKIHTVAINVSATRVTLAMVLPAMI